MALPRRLSSDTGWSLWPVATMLSLAIVGVIVMGVMLLTGYMPPTGFGKNPTHALRFGLVAGVTCGAMLGTLVTLWERGQ